MSRQSTIGNANLKIAKGSNMLMNNLKGFSPAHKVYQLENTQTKTLTSPLSFF